MSRKCVMAFSYFAFSKPLNRSLKSADFAFLRSFSCKSQIHGEIENDVSSKSTIYALSSGHGKCGVAVIRISGPDSKKSLQKMTRIKNLEPRKTFLRHIYDPETKETIDKGLCLWFPGPNSFSGEDSVEFQVHGGAAVVSALFGALSKLNFRPAEAGEFTRRAFFNEKLDLVEIEGLADLIHAETEQQRKIALLQSDGCLSALYGTWRGALLNSVASLEAYVDFAEDDNIEDDVVDRSNADLRRLAGEIRGHLSDGRKGEILRDGARVVILGEPNAGKSSLFNCLAQRNAAIVTPIAGTTRDVLEVNVNVAGYPVILMDTAGLTSSEDVVEVEGIRRAKVRAETADFLVLVVDSYKFFESKMSCRDYVGEYVRSLGLEEVVLREGKLRDDCLVVFNKMDLLEDGDLGGCDGVALSCQTEKGIDGFLKVMEQKLEALCGNINKENPTVSQLRHRIHLTQCLRNIDEYFEMVSSKNSDMIIANQKLRDAMRELGKITGHVTTEDILDVIFQNFCIGK